MNTQLLTDALNFADTAHRGQLRRYSHDEFIIHPTRVGFQAAKHGLPDEAIAAAYLHDVIEDTDVTYQDLASAGFPKRTIALVRLLTKWWDTGEPNERVVTIYRRSYYAAICADPIATDLKILDRTDNLEDRGKLLPANAPWVKDYVAVTEAEFPALIANCFREGIIERYHTTLDRLHWAILHATNARYAEGSDHG